MKIYLVQCIDMNDLETFNNKSFNSRDEAETYFVKTLKRVFDIDEKEGVFTPENVKEILESGYYADTTSLAIELKEIDFV